jgi:hypothetical protein
MLEPAKAILEKRLAIGSGNNVRTGEHTAFSLETRGTRRKVACPIFKTSNQGEAWTSQSLIITVACFVGFRVRTIGSELP